MTKKQPLNPIIVNNQYGKLYNQYRNRLAEYYARADMAGVMEASEDIPVNLRDIYVPLRIDEEDIPRIGSSKQVEDISGTGLEDALNQQRFLAISGLPGSGKTTLTHFLAGELSKNAANASIRQLGRQLVLPIVLRELDFSTIDNFEQLFDQWRTQMAQRLGLALPQAFFDNYLAHHWALVIFDGFDEVGETINRRLIRWIDDWLSGIEQSSNNQGQTSNRFYCLITGRPSGFLSQVDYQRHFKKYHLQPFNQQQIEQYVGNWYQVRYPKDSLIQQAKTTDFIAKLKQFKGLAELKHRPIYLAMLAYVAETYGELPLTRTLAYGKMVDAYIHQLELIKQLQNKPEGHNGHLSAQNWSYDDKLRVMEELAFALHTQASSTLEQKKHYEREAEQMQILISRTELQQHITRALKQGRFNSMNADDAEALTAYFVARTGLLIEPKQDYYQFSHLTFQEFLTAKRIYRKISKRDPIKYIQKNIFNQIGQTGWHEVALLYFGIDTLNSGEDHHYILQRCLNENSRTHQQFLIDLLMTTDHTLSDDEAKTWINTLIYLWLTRTAGEPNYNLDFYLAHMLKKDTVHPDYAPAIAQFMKMLFSQLAIEDYHFEPQLLIVDDSEEDSEEDRDKKEPLLSQRLPARYAKTPPSLERLLQIGIHHQPFRASLDNTAIAGIELTTNRRETARELSDYYPHNPAAIAAKCFSLNRISDFISDEIAQPRGVLFDNQLSGLARVVQQLSISGWYATIFRLGGTHQSQDNQAPPTSPTQTIAWQLDFIPDREPTNIYRFGGNPATTIASIMASALNLAKYLNQYRDRDRAMVRTMDMDMDMAMDMAIAMVRTMDMASDMVKTMELANEILLSADWSDPSNKQSQDALDWLSHFIIFATHRAAKQAAKHLVLTLPTDRAACRRLYQQIADDDSAIGYFQQQCQQQCQQQAPDEITPERADEIKHWLAQPGSPRQLLKALLDNPNTPLSANQGFDKPFDELFDELFDEQRVKEDFHRHSQAFVAEYK